MNNAGRIVGLGALLLAIAVSLSGCHAQPAAGDSHTKTGSAGPAVNTSSKPPVANPGKVIHVLVALCDNQYQGIVPVPARIGNGDDPANNLYWGAAYGVRTFFERSKDWKLIKNTQSPEPAVLERVVFKHKVKDVYIVADAYRGREIRQATVDLLRFAAGAENEAIEVELGSRQIGLTAGAGADLIAYVGHDGLMDFTLAEYPRKSDDRRRDVIILACASKEYFKDAIRETGANPLLWTTGLMAPEAYVLRSAIDGWMVNESAESIRKRAAGAYNTYQKCGMRAAMNLFSNGW